MMASHSLVKILSGFARNMLCMNNILYFIGDPHPLFIVLALTGLKFKGKVLVSILLGGAILNDY